MIAQITQVDKLCNRNHNCMEAANYRSPYIYDLKVDTKVQTVTFTLNIKVDPQKMKEILRSIIDGFDVFPKLMNVNGKVVLFFNLRE